jgi:hypothetical protein
VRNDRFAVMDGWNRGGYAATGGREVAVKAVQWRTEMRLDRTSLRLARTLEITKMQSKPAAAAAYDRLYRTSANTVPSAHRTIHGASEGGKGQRIYL